MTITFAQQQALAADVALGTRILAALVQQAATVAAESQAAQTEVVNTARQGLVQKVVQNPGSVQQPAQTACANNPTIQTEAYSGGPLNTALVPDSDILFVIGQQWNSLAGLRPKLDY